MLENRMLEFKTILAKPEQARELQALVNHGYGQETTRLPGSRRYPKIEEVITLIQSTNWMIVQDPEHDNKIIGSLMIDNDDENLNKINAFAVDSSYRGKGLAQVLLQSAEQFLVEKSVNEVFLEVISVANRPLDDCQIFTKKKETICCEENSLANYYQRLGFVFTDNVIFTPHAWQAEFRKTEYVTRVFFREMRKELGLI